MSQRQIIQGEKRCILCLHRGRMHGRRRGSMLCFLCSLQFSTSTRNPGCSSSKLWQTWQPARRTLSSCKTQVRKQDRCRFLFPIRLCFASSCPAAGVMPLLHPLMLDVVPGIQQTAARALGHLADQSEDMAIAVVRQDILPQMVRSLSRQNVSTSR